MVLVGPARTRGLLVESMPPGITGAWDTDISSHLMSRGERDLPVGAQYSASVSRAYLTVAQIAARIQATHRLLSWSLRSRRERLSKDLVATLLKTFPWWQVPLNAQFAFLSAAPGRSMIPLLKQALGGEAPQTVASYSSPRGQAHLFSSLVSTPWVAPDFTPTRE